MSDGAKDPGTWSVTLIGMIPYGETEYLELLTAVFQGLF